MGSLRAQGNGNSTTSSQPTQCWGVRKELPAGWWLHPPQAFLAWALGREDRLCLEQALAALSLAGDVAQLRQPEGTDFGGLPVIDLTQSLPFLFQVGMSPPAYPPGVEGEGR